MRYIHWLHTRWPAGMVEKLPVTGPDGATDLPGVRIVGDLTGIPLLKFSADTGARAVQAILKERDFRPGSDSLDLAIIGAGVSGISAALEANKAELNFKVFEAVQPFSTIVNFPKGKLIYTYPTEMTPAGELRFKASVKEDLLEELEAQRQGIEVVPARIEKIERQGGLLQVDSYRAKRVIVAIGRSGNYRKLGVPGENLDKVYNRLYDPKECCGKSALVVGGGDSALETAIALAVCGAHVTLSYRGKEFSRPKPGNIEKIQMLQRDPQARTSVEQPKSDRTNVAMDADNAGAHPPGSLRLLMASSLKEIRQDSVVIDDATILNDVVFVMIGREAPLDFFRRSKIAIRGEWTGKTWAAFVAFFLFCVVLYVWKSQSSAVGFYYSLTYCVAVVSFGFDRMRRKPTPYVRVQTLTLITVQIVPLFVLPYFILPALGRAGWFDAGVGKLIGDNLFPNGEYWRSFGFILAWPLFIWNFFTAQPLWWWLGIGLVQTFVIIPLIVWRWGKGAYCGWICPCGALAETMGDRHRQKMPHGPKWNRLNMTGQVIFALAFVLFALRAVTWAWPGTFLNGLFDLGLGTYYKVVDIGLAGIVGVAAYFWFSGRVWCRFACPLAALMHIYARFSRFRIFPEKSKCISCNVCTSVCHQGIDIMNFANKGLPVQDPECVRCSACVQECPTGVLTFGRYDIESKIMLDKLAASPVRVKETKS